MITSVKRLGYFSVLGRIDWRIRRRGARNKQLLVDFFGRITHLTPFVFCKKYADPFGSPGAKPLAGAKRQKERSPKERSDHISETVGIFLGLGTC